MPRIKQVREPDGSLSPYRERKIAEAIRRSLSDTGAGDRGLAEELAGVVSLFLERAHPDAEKPPRISEIQDIIERVLRECGHDAAARRFRKTRAQREELRDQIAVRDTARKRSDDVSAAGGGGGERGAETSKWSRTRLVRSLADTFELPGPLAEEVASAVERKVFALELKSVTADLIRHVVACELFERGVETGDRAGERVPILMRSLTEDLFGPEPAERAPGEAIAGAVLEHVALTEVHGAEVAGAHAEGVLHVHGLDNPLAIERLALPWDLAVRPGPGAGSHAILDLRRMLDALRPHVAGTIELVDAVPRLLARAGDALDALDDLLDSVVARDAYGRPLGPAIELVIPIEGASADVVRRVAARIRADSSGAVRVRFTHPAPPASCDGETLAAALDLLSGSPFVSLDLVRDEDRAPPPGVLQLSLGRVTLNLPSLLLNAAGDGLKEALAGLDRGAKLALEAFQERAWLQRKGPPFGLQAVVAAVGGAGRIVVPASGQEVDLEVWGLSHALELLVTRGLVPRPSVPEAAARILGHLLYHLGEEREGIRFLVRTGGCAARAVRKRMLLAAESNARRFAAADLVAELANGRSAEGLLPLAIPLSDRRNRPLLKSGALDRLGPGLGLSVACLANGLTPLGLREIRETSRIRRFTLAPPGSGAPFEVQEELFG